MRETTQTLLGAGLHPNLVTAINRLLRQRRSMFDQMSKDISFNPKLVRRQYHKRKAMGGVDI